jgi:hypothetical protein
VPVEIPCEAASEARPGPYRLEADGQYPGRADVQKGKISSPRVRGILLWTGAVRFFRFDPTQAAANRKKSSGHALVGAVAYVSLTIRRSKPTPGRKAARYQLAANKQRKRRVALDDSPSCGADNVVRKFVPTIIN